MTLPNGIYRIKTSTGAFADDMAVQMRDGKGRPVRITNNGNWGYAREAFGEMTAEQLDKLAEYGLHDNQALAQHTK
jgi:hypothetical protein